MKHTVLAVLTAATLAACGSASSDHAAPGPAATGIHQRQVQAVIATDHGPSRLIVGHDALFLGAHRGGSVQRIDPVTNRITGTLVVGGQLELEDSTTVGGLAAMDERTTSLWACSNADGVLHQIDPRAMRVSATVQAHCDGGWRTRVGSNLWAVPGGDNRTLLLIDVNTAKVVHRLDLGDPAYGWGPAVPSGGRVVIGSGTTTPVLSAAGELLSRSPVDTPWIVGTGGRIYRIPSDGALTSLDPSTLAVLKTYRLPKHLPDDGDPQLVADDHGHLYYRPDSTHVYVVDAASGAVKPLLDLPYGETITSMAWAFGSLWITNFDADTIWRVDPAA